MTPGERYGKRVNHVKNRKKWSINKMSYCRKILACRIWELLHPTSTLLVKLFTPSPPTGSVPHWIFFQQSNVLRWSPEKTRATAQLSRRFWRSKVPFFLQNICLMPPKKIEVNKEIIEIPLFYRKLFHTKKRWTSEILHDIHTKKAVELNTHFQINCFNFPSRRGAVQNPR